MSGGSIYIDPDSVSYVSSQIGMTAAQLDSLRQTIVPRVNEVISMSYPSIHEMPGVAYPLNSSQGSIEAFNYRAQILVEDLRTTSRKLSQIAEAGRTMNDILLRQTTMFGVTSQVGNMLTISSNLVDVESLSQQFTGYIGTEAGFVPRLIKALSNDKGLADWSDYDKLQELSGWMDDPVVNKGLLNKLSHSGLIFGIVGLIADIISNGKHDPKSLISDAIGAGISTVITINPVGEAIIGTFGAINIIGAGLGGLQGSLANQYAGNPQLKQALASTANGLTDASKHADPQKVFDDVGGTLFDIGAAFGSGNWTSVGQDARGMLNDTASTLYSIPEFVGNAAIMIQQDSDLGKNALVQNLPLPQSWKSAYQASTISDIKATGQIANSINAVPAQASKLTDVAQNIITTSNQQLYN